MVKKTGIGLCVFLAMFLVSFADNNSKILQEKEVELKIKELREKIQELAVKIERNPEAEDADKWRSEHRKYINELEKLLAVSRAELQKRKYTDLEWAIKQSKEKLHELELAIESMKKKEESKEKIKVYQERMAEEEQHLEGLIHMLELRSTGQRTEEAERERQVDQPTAYQRERGELTAYVISSTENDVTVRVKDSSRVMVLRVRKWLRVEGRRVENREEMDFVNSLKKGELIWANYTEGEERGSFFILEIKRVGK